MVSRARILVVDDEPQIHRFLGPALDAAGYEPARADTGAEALREIARRPPDAVVLDLGLPDMDGKVVLIQTRAFYNGPIIILSARDRELEKIEALDNGANDYVEKPFGVGELLARLRVALRERADRAAPLKVVQAGDLTIDFDKHLVTRAGVPIRLSPKEFEVLTALAEGGGVWGPAHGEDTQYLRVFIGQLRQKLELLPSDPTLIVTEPGVGYRFVAPAL